MGTQTTSFFSKNAITCPVCEYSFQKEELQTGRGRLNAGALTEELRRLYIPTKKYGIVDPLLYPILVCPNCFIAGLGSDFSSENTFNAIEADKETPNRKNLLQGIFGTTPDFTQYRDTVTGAASYILAFSSTIHLPKICTPTGRRGLYALRGAWLISDLYKKSNITHFQDLAKELYYQAYINYDKSLELQIKNKEPFDGLRWMGPDVDTNYGYDGMLYIIAYLTVMHINNFTPSEQIIKIGQVKRVLSRIFGVGKSSREKPEVLVSNAKNLYSTTNDLLKQLESGGHDISEAHRIENEEDPQS